MPATYEPIATSTVSGSTTSSITFSSIPGTYTDLRLVLVAANPTSNDSFGLRFNSNTSTTNYSDTYLNADGASATSGKDTSASLIYAGNINATPNWGLYTYDIFNYAGSTNKTVLVQWSNDRNGAGSVGREVGLWRSTSAITDIFIMNTTFATGTVATLYGIKAA